MDDGSSHSRKRRKISPSPASGVEVDQYPKELPLVTGCAPLRRQLAGLEVDEFEPQRNGLAIVGFCLTKNQNGIADGFFRVMSTTLWLGKRGAEPESDSVILQLVKKFGKVSDVSFRQDDVFIKYAERNDAAKAHRVLAKQLDDGTKKFCVGWGKPPRIPREAFNFQNGIGIMSQDDLGILSNKTQIMAPPGTTLNNLMQSSSDLNRFSSQQRSQQSPNDYSHNRQQRNQHSEPYDYRNRPGDNNENDLSHADNLRELSPHSSSSRGRRSHHGSDNNSEYRSITYQTHRDGDYGRSRYRRQQRRPYDSPPQSNRNYNDRRKQHRGSDSCY